MKRLKRIFACLAALILCLSAAGCGLAGAEDLYSLPRIADTYQKLQTAVDGFLDRGSRYSSPTAGSHRQAVQLEDLDGDGVMEAVAFFKLAEDDEPMQICVFRSVEGEYEQAVLIGGEGSGFDRVAYADLDGDGVLEILAGYQISAEIKMLCVYRIRDDQPETLFSTGYTQYEATDLTGDGRTDALVVRMNAASATGEAEAFTVSTEGEVHSSRAPLSLGAESLSRLRVTTLAGGENAVLAECVYHATGLVTDLFVWNGGGLRNLTADDASGVSGTARPYNVDSADINGDRVVEIPWPEPMSVQNDGMSYYRLNWYAYGALGQRFLRAVTYHNYSDGWYYDLEPGWADHVTVRRRDAVSGERAVIFSVTDGEGNVLYDYLTVSVLTGDNREELAEQPGRLVLAEEGGTIYTAQILYEGDGFGGDLDPETVQTRFHFIYSDWETGEY